jgi:hypothetical protein
MLRSSNRYPRTPVALSSYPTSVWCNSSTLGSDVLAERKRDELLDATNIKRQQVEARIQGELQNLFKLEVAELKATQAARAQLLQQIIAISDGLD